MNLRYGALLLSAALACGPGGCGTATNLWSPPESLPTTGPTTCYPFGGITRSVFVGGLMVAEGLDHAVNNLGNGGLVTAAGMTVAGTLVFAVDGPLSLAGDLLTLPVAYARSEKAPWATWWGEQTTAAPFQDGGQPAPATPPPGETRPGPESGATAAERPRQSPTRDAGSAPQAPR
jgi:hypothetical protein